MAGSGAAGAEAGAAAAEPQVVHGVAEKPTMLGTGAEAAEDQEEAGAAAADG